MTLKWTNWAFTLPWAQLVLLCLTGCQPPRSALEEVTADFPQAGRALLNVGGVWAFRDWQRTRWGCVTGGDILVTCPSETSDDTPEQTDQPLATVSTSLRWPQKTLIYDYPKDFPRPERVSQAIAKWESATSIRFRRRTTEVDYVQIVNGEGECSSHVGRAGGKQVLILGDTCDVGNTVHEFGHALGLHHEQARFDRDEQITVHWDRADPSSWSNFETQPAFSRGPYDVRSVMHYSSLAFSAGRLPVMLMKNGAYINRARTPSEGDRRNIEEFYAASADPSHVPAGPIAQKYTAGGGVTNYGRCLTPERGLSDGAGKVSHFEKGSIFWRSGLGAFFVSGWLLDHYLRLGAERSFLGYPISDSVYVAPEYRSDFQHGSIFVDTKTRAARFVHAVKVSKVVLSAPLRTLVVGSSLALSAKVLGPSDVPLPTAVTWRVVEGGNGTISTSGTVLAGTRPGPLQIRATAGGVSADISLNVEPKANGRVQILPETAVALAPGGETAIEALFYDSNNQPILAAPQFEAVGPAGTLAEPGVFRAGTQLGFFERAIRVSGGGLVGWIHIQVITGAPSRIEITPPSLTVAAGEKATFSARGWVGSGDPFPFDFRWAATGNEGLLRGAIDTEGVFLSTVAGPYRILALSSNLGQDVAGASTVLVVPGPLVSLAVTPARVTLRPGDSVKLTASGEDSFGNVAEGVAATWSLLQQEAGSMTSEGTFTARNSAGLFGEAIRAERDGVQVVVPVDIRGDAPDVPEEGPQTTPSPTENQPAVGTVQAYHSCSGAGTAATPLTILLPLWFLRLRRSRK